MHMYAHLRPALCLPLSLLVFLFVYTQKNTLGLLSVALWVGLEGFLLAEVKLQEAIALLYWSHALKTGMVMHISLGGSH